MIFNKIELLELRMNKMRKSIRIAAVILVSVLISKVSLGWNDNSKSTATNSNSKPGVVNAKAANCSPATTLNQLALNNVNALIETGGSMWQDRAQNNGAYEVPIGSGNSSIYAGALWLGGVDVNNQLKIAALQFRADGNDFWTGPLTTIPGTGNGADIRDFGPAEIEPDVCDQYDKFYITTRLEVSEFRGWFRCGEDPECDQGIEYAGYTIPTSILEWPAHGDIGRFQDFYLATFYDFNDD